MDRFFGTLGLMLILIPLFIMVLIFFILVIAWVAMQGWWGFIYTIGAGLICMIIGSIFEKFNKV